MNKYIDVIIILNSDWIYGSIFIDWISHMIDHKLGVEHHALIVLKDGSKIIVTDTVQVLRKKINDALLTTS